MLIQEEGFLKSFLIILIKSKILINKTKRASEFNPDLIPNDINASDKWKNDPCRNPALPIVTVINFFKNALYHK